MKENQRTSTESSITSFSSSSCSSSLSSIDAKQSHPEPSSYAPKNVPGSPTGDLPISQPNNSLQLSRQPVDFRDVVKDSMYREAREISIRNATKANAGGQTLKYMDSPRPLQQPKSFKSRDSSQIESFRVLAKLREAPWSSNERKDRFAAQDAPRFSYDGRESIKSTIKLKELPRLSLDSKVHSMRGSTTEMKSNYLLGDMQRVNGNSSILNQQQEPGSNKRPSSLIAKLMGLEAFPDSMSTNRNQPNQNESLPDVQFDAISGLSKTTLKNKQNQTSGSPRNSIKEPVSPRIKNANSVKKPTSSSKFPIEPAPWQQQEGSKGQTPASLSQETPTRASNSSLSVYGEIEKRLAQLEFKKSGKDLRALKQILEAMQKTKEILESREEDQASSFASQTGDNNRVDPSSILANSDNLKRGNPTSTKTKRICSPKGFRSPIVVMKAAKSIEKNSNPASSAIQNESLSGHQCRAGRKESVEKRTKDPTQRSNYLQDPSSRPIHLTNKDTRAKSLRLGQTSKSSHPTTGKTNSRKCSESLNPRLEHKELKLENQSHSRTPSSDLSRSRRQHMESGSPQRQSRSKSQHLGQSDDQLSDISIDVRYLTHQGDASSLQSGSYISMGSYVGSEVSSTDRSDKISGAFFLQHSPTVRVITLYTFNYYLCHLINSFICFILLTASFFFPLIQYPAAGYIGDKSTAEPGIAGPEQPSPVSVLDATFYRDEPPSPVRKISHAFTGEPFLDIIFTILRINCKTLAILIDVFTKS